MSLATRLLTFFMLILAMVLVAFSATLYSWARSYLHRQVIDQVTSTLDTMVAAAEVEPDGLDWEPELRQLPSRWEGDPPVWVIHDENNIRVDGSSDPGLWIAGFAGPSDNMAQELFQVAHNGSIWWLSRQTIRHPYPDKVRHPPSGERKKRFKSLVFVTAVPLVTAQHTLTALGWALVAISLSLLGLSGVSGYYLFRRALLPLTTMAVAARKISNFNVCERLPQPNTHDELDSLAVAFNGVLSRLQVAFERQQRFAGEASHQLRTPLAAMLGQLEVALRKNRPDSDYRNALESVSQQAVRMRQIVEALLFLARPDVDATLPESGPLNLGNWLNEHMRFVWESHPRWADLAVDLPESDCILKNIHPVLLGQAIDNLVDNAFKYSPIGTPVKVQVHMSNNIATLMVRNKGSDIFDDEIESVFDPFFRGRQATKNGIAGLGLGLAVCSRIVNAFYGTVMAKRNDAGDTIFIVALPMFE